jgi:hypothetical protein
MRWKAKDYTEWHPHFAIRPIKVDGEWVWFERILRKGYKMLTKETRARDVYRWDYVNSEFDLIKRVEREREMQEMNMGQLAMGQNIAKSATYNPSGLTVTGSMGLKMPNMSGTAQNIINEIRSKQS